MAEIGAVSSAFTIVSVAYKLSRYVSRIANEARDIKEASGTISKKVVRWDEVLRAVHSSLKGRKRQRRFKPLSEDEEQIWLAVGNALERCQQTMKMFKEEIERLGDREKYGWLRRGLIAMNSIEDEPKTIRLEKDMKADIASLSVLLPCFQLFEHEERLTLLRAGNAITNRYLPPIVEAIEKGEIRLRKLSQQNVLQGTVHKEHKHDHDDSSATQAVIGRGERYTHESLDLRTMKECLGAAVSFRDKLSRAGSVIGQSSGDMSQQDGSSGVRYDLLQGVVGKRSNTESETDSSDESDGGGIPLYTPSPPSHAWTRHEVMESTGNAGESTEHFPHNRDDTVPPEAIMNALIDNFKDNAQNDFVNERYYSAERHLLDAIEYGKKRLEIYNFPFDEIVELREQLAEAYTKQEKFSEAEQEYLCLIGESRKSSGRYGRLCCALATVYQKKYYAGNEKDCKLFEVWEDYSMRSLHVALDSPRQGNTLLQRSAKLLVDLYEKQNKPAFAKPYRELYLTTPQATSDSGYASAWYERYSSQKIPELTEDDSATIYTQQTDIDTSNTRRFIHELAGLIFHGLALESFGDGAAFNVHSCLESLLKTFAIRLAYDGSERAGRSMVFVHRHRKVIVEAFKSMSSQMGERPELLPRVKAVDPIGKVIDWITDEEDDRSFNEMPDQTEWDDEEFPEEEDIHEITEYRELIENSEAYHWLISQLKCNILLSRQYLEGQCRIRDQVLNSFPGPLKISRRNLPEKVQANFILHWDPLKFLQVQYSEAPFSVFETAITLTGSFEEAQATTCRQYLEQTWSHMAETVLRLIGGALKGGYGYPHEERSHDGTSLTMNLSKDCTSVVVVGFRESTAEVGEILAWLGSALRSSPELEEVAICRAIVNLRPTTSIVSSSTRLSCEYPMDFQLTVPETVEGNGKCWLKMFRNPTIATGFPILSRTERNTGLELPLNMMAGLGQAKYVTAFNGSMFLKGFSTMLFPTRQAGDTIFWHLLYNEDRRRISYRDCRVHHHRNSNSESITYSEIERSRHVVGWSSAVKVHAGAVDGNYDIRRSGLKNSVSGAILDKVSLSVGKVANVGANFNIGVKDIPLHLRSEGTYRDQIQDVYSNYVIFYDTEDERAWLLNGATALLHIVRASLEEYRSPRHHISLVQSLFTSGYCFPPEKFLEASTPHMSTSAVEVLLAEHNRDLVVDRDKSAQRVENTKREDGKIETVTRWDEKIFTFQDLVEQKWHILEQILDYQCSWGASGLEVKLPTRQHLKGFDFTDVATRTQDLSLKVTALKVCGKAWIDFARSIRAITLFGKGFGDVFKPSDCSNQLCVHWAEIPKGPGYLAVCVADLIAISSRRGDPGAKPIRLVDDICWHKPDKLFDACKCKDAPLTKLPFGRRKACDRVQVLLPASARFQRVNSPASFLSTLEGAVLFGHSKTFPLKWRDHGDPEEGVPEQDPVEMEPQPSDSGLGSSLTSSESYSVKSSWLTWLLKGRREKLRTKATTLSRGVRAPSNE